MLLNKLFGINNMYLMLFVVFYLFKDFRFELLFVSFGGGRFAEAGIGLFLRTIFDV